MLRTRLVAAALGTMLLSAGCASAGAVNEGPDTPTSGAGMCAPETPDCVDTVVDGEVDAEAARAEAAALIGLTEDELPADVRVGRRGEEHLPLTEDYVIGRQTVELDRDTGGVYRVSAVITELPDGPETIRSD